MNDSRRRPPADRLQRVLTSVEQAAQACVTTAQDAADQLGQWAASRRDAADQLQRRCQTFGQKLAAAGKASQNGLTSLRAALESYGVALGQLSSVAAQVARQVTVAVEQAGGNRQSALTLLDGQLKQYVRVAEQGRQEVLEQLLEGQDILRQSQPPAAHACEAISRAGHFAGAIVRQAEQEKERDGRERARLWNRKGCEELAEGKLDAARDSFRNACQLCSAAEPRFNLALTYCLQNDLEQSRQALAEARSLGLPPAVADALAAVVALTANDTPAINLAATQLPNAGPTSPLTEAVTATCLLAAGRAADGLRHLAMARWSNAIDVEDQPLVDLSPESACGAHGAAG